MYVKVAKEDFNPIIIANFSFFIYQKGIFNIAIDLLIINIFALNCKETL